MSQGQWSLPHDSQGRVVNRTKIKGHFMQVPNDFVRANVNSPAMLALWLASHSTTYRITKAGMATVLGVNRKRLDRWLSELVEAGYLEMVLIEGSAPRRPQYEFLIDLSAEVEPHERPSTSADDDGHERDTTSDRCAPPVTINIPKLMVTDDPLKNTTLQEHQLEEQEDQGERQAAPVAPPEKTKAAPPLQKIKVTLVPDEEDQKPRRFGVPAPEAPARQEPKAQPRSDYRDEINSMITRDSQISARFLARSSGADETEVQSYLDTQVSEGLLVKLQGKAIYAGANTLTGRRWLGQKKLPRPFPAAPKVQFPIAAQ